MENPLIDNKMVNKQVSTNNKMKNNINVNQAKVSSNQIVNKGNKEKLSDNKHDKSKIKVGGLNINDNKTLHINKDWTISDIFKRFPDKVDEASEVLTEYGLHCVGCNANQFETIAEGCDGHGFDEEIIDSMVDDLNKVISKKDVKKEETEGDKERDDGITITKSALVKLSDILSRKSKELKNDVFLRINFNGDNDSGEDVCCKNLYSLGFEGKPSKKDVVVDTANSDVKLVLNKSHIDNFSGITIDYLDSEETKGFKITASMNNKECCGGEEGGCCSH